MKNISKDEHKLAELFISGQTFEAEKLLSTKIEARKKIILEIFNDFVEEYPQDWDTPELMQIITDTRKLLQN